MFELPEYDDQVCANHLESQGWWPDCWYIKSRAFAYWQETLGSDCTKCKFASSCPRMLPLIDATPAEFRIDVDCDDYWTIQAILAEARLAYIRATAEPAINLSRYNRALDILDESLNRRIPD